MLQHVFSKSLFALLLGGVFLNVPMEAFAQRRGTSPQPEKVRVGAPTRRAPKGVRLPAGYSHYYHHGVFYQKRTSGYLVVRAPVGARVKTLPVGYVTVHVGTRPYSYYHGTSYAYSPHEDVYMVAERPGDGQDVIEGAFVRTALVDGSTLEGIYPGGTQSTVQFEVAGETLEIPVADRVSLSFAPAPSSTQ